MEIYWRNLFDASEFNNESYKVSFKELFYRNNNDVV